MKALDTNVLVTAHRAELDRHEKARAWIRHLAEGSQPWGLPVFTIGEFVRVVTHPRIFDPPTPLDEALSAMERLLRSPMVRVLSPGDRYPEHFAAACRAADARGNLAFDAQIAAVCVEQGAPRLLTLDRDFARFPSLEIVPFDDGPE